MNILEIENNVLGAILFDKEVIYNIADLLNPEIFTNAKNKTICQTILDLYNSNKPIDIVTVSNEVKKKDASITFSYLTSLTISIINVYNVDSYIKILRENYVYEKLKVLANNILQDTISQKKEAMDILYDIEKETSNIFKELSTEESIEVKNIVEEYYEVFKKILNSEIDLVGIPSYYTELDRITGGWQKSDLIIIAGRPAMGKTSFVLSMIHNIAFNSDFKIAIFSLEMSKQQLISRFISIITEINLSQIRDFKLSEEEIAKIEKAIEEIKNKNILIDDTTNMNIHELKMKCKKFKKQYDIDLIVVDYLQLLRATNKQSREQEVAEISRTLKQIAKELNIPVIALSQLNRAVEHRSDRRPTLADLRESGAIEQDADIVLFIHRPEKYGILEDEKGNSLKGIAEIIIAKHRNGAIGTIRMKFCEQNTKFIDIENYYLNEF